MQGLSQKLFFNFQSITPFSGLPDYNVNNNEKKISIVMTSFPMPKFLYLFATKKLKSLNKQKFSLISFIGPKTVVFQRITCSKKSAVFSISVSVYRTGKSLGAS